MRTLLVPGSLLFAVAAHAFTLQSPAFAPGGAIPGQYTCQGADVSPALRWNDVPSGTRSFVLIVEDPDVPDPAAPRRTWVHWVLYDLPGTATGLPEDVVYEALPDGTRQGKNDWGRAGWGGPCPPIGRHRYQFKLYALSAPLPDLGLASARDLERAMTGLILARAELVGTYEKR